jgi:hypothetical protein
MPRVRLTDARADRRSSDRATHEVRARHQLEDGVVLEHMKMIGWQLFTEAQIVQWCGHAQHFLVVPDADGERAALVPIFGEAA